MKFPVDVNTPEMELAKAITAELVIDGFDSGLALPMAIHIMSACNVGHDDPLLGVDQLKRERRQSDEWWVKHHPTTDEAERAKIRLGDLAC